jgi:hypothetical protein
MNVVAETLGLTDPIRYVWTLHDRYFPPGAPPCPQGAVYTVIQRNFDTAIGSSLSLPKSTNYVNGVLYSYVIPEACTGGNPLALAAGFPVDASPLALASIPVASGLDFGAVLLTTDPIGAFFTGLTRDDVGGLRYLLGTNNVSTESGGANTLSFVTDTTQSQLVFPSNLTVLAAQALTNSAAALGALYPNLLITSSTNTFVNVLVTNVIAYFTNYPWAHAGAPAQIAFATNVTFTIQQQFHHTFGNLLSIRATTNGFVSNPLVTIPPPTNLAYVTIQTVAITNSPYAPAGVAILETNTSYKTYLSNQVVGEYYILPPGQCDVAILAAQLTNVTTTTNLILSVTNIAAGATNLLGEAYNQFRIDYFTNHYYVVFPVNCLANTTALRQGMNSVTFVKADFDSLLGTFFTPFTNEYVLNVITNGMIVPQRMRRTISTPDLLFSAADLAAGPANGPPNVAYNPMVLRRNINYNQGNILPGSGLAGPGTIDPGPAQMSFIFNKVGPLFLNTGQVSTNEFIDELNGAGIFQWGSFDGTTNAPIVYPNDVSIANLQNQMLIQISPAFLQDGAVNMPYSAQLTAQAAVSNWVPPYSWSIAPGSQGLPPGLTISTSSGTGVISGSPTQSGFFDFVVRLTDSTGQTTDRNYYITVNP